MGIEMRAQMPFELRQSVPTTKRNCSARRPTAESR